LVIENLANSETSVGHGTHVAGIVAAMATASNGYYTGVAPGANLIGIGTGRHPVHLLGSRRLRLHPRSPGPVQHQGREQFVGHERRVRPKDPINEATKKVTSRGITVVFAAGTPDPARTR